jgi:hypothetical protein
MRKLLIWFKNLLRWLFVEPWLFWATLLVLVAVCSLRTEPAFRIAGGLFQLFGVGVVAWGIHETRVLFGRPSILALSRQWFRRIPGFPRNIAIGAGALVAGNAFLSAQASVWNHAGPHDLVEMRITALEKNQIELRTQIDRLRTDNDSRFREQKDKFETEVTNRNKEVAELRTKLEVTETGGLHLSAYGVGWIFLGVIMSTLSTELACLAR